MRSLAERIVRDAAVAAGLPAERVGRKSEKEDKLAPSPRLEIEFLPEGLTRDYDKIARFRTPGREQTHETIRARIYTRRLEVRADVHAEDEEWLEAFVPAFLLALPARTADADNNLLRVEAFRASLGGFDKKRVEVFRKRMAALHLRFTGMLCRDEELPLVRELNIKDGLTFKAAKEA
ncbi:hypothetical protein V6C53_16765 [Desulfocurvibacter africanus]|uniref:hypothetical protein n=1 Tax=Desulfocurvibacter africanus TaxID=873 RepID=UPI002FDA93E6